MLFPATACLVQHNLGATKAWGFDLVAACSGFRLWHDDGRASGGGGNASEGAGDRRRHHEPHHRLHDRATCVLFGDGAGAMLIEPARGQAKTLGFIDFMGEIDGSGGDYLKMPAGGSRMPASAETVAQQLHYVQQDGQQVFKYAVKKMYESVYGAAGAQWT